VVGADALEVSRRRPGDLFLGACRPYPCLDKVLQRRGIRPRGVGNSDDGGNQD
jgi:hypothetical protein